MCLVTYELRTVNRKEYLDDACSNWREETKGSSRFRAAWRDDQKYFIEYVER
nr:hypothetical protein [Candidatus Njordarchaeota archaeon]